MTSVPRQRAVFLDRDGTLNVEKDYLHRPEEFEFVPGAPDAIRALRGAGFKVIVVTNQSGVARGYFGPQAVVKLHAHIQALLAAAGTQIDAFYFCPHHPSAGLAPYRLDCDCRKGKPGMLLTAANEHVLDLSGSFMVGDKAADIEAGARAGCRSILVRTGYGSSEIEAASRWGALVVADLPAAADWILEHASGTTP